MTYQIEKGLPIPPEARGNKVNPNSVMGTLRRMEVGDSLLIDRPQKACVTHNKLIGMKFTTRKVSENQTRIWRIA
jgi:hypothetical protein